jgi:poly(3-hydroxybutyrate) depolymerase
MKTSAVAVALAWSLSIGGGEPGKVQKLTFGAGGTTRTYYQFVPERNGTDPLPVMLLLHGSGRNGKSLVDPWLPLAKSEGIVLVAPDASNPQAWRIPEEGPEFFYNLMEIVRRSENIDDRRMYVFGHSAGARHGLGLGLLESEYFAAVAVHAGAISRQEEALLDRTPRKIPMAIWVGTNDSFFPLSAVRQSRDVLNAHGFNTELTEITGHTHDYYGSASGINKQVWAFLRQHKLAADPQYQEYQLIRR